MSPIEGAVLERKLQTITESLKLLAPIAKMDIETYRSDVYRRKGVERILQELVESMVDINLHVLRNKGAAVPDDMHGSFSALADAGILDSALAGDLAPSAGLRNRLVHEYDRLDDVKIIEAIHSALAQVPSYVATIMAFVERSSKEQ